LDFPGQEVLLRVFLFSMVLLLITIDDYDVKDRKEEYER